MLAEVKGGGWEPADWSPDDKQLLVLEGISINESYLWLFDTQTGEKKEVTPRPAEGAEKVSYSAALFSKDGKGIFVTTDRESEFQRLAYIDLASGKHTYLLPDAKFDVDNWDLSHDGKQIAYTLNENGVSTLHLIEVVPGKGTVTAGAKKDPAFNPPLPAVVISGLRWHRDPKQSLLAFNVAGARSPSDVYTWSTAGGKNTPRAGRRARPEAFPRRGLSSRNWCAGNLSMAKRSPDSSTCPIRRNSPGRGRSSSISTADPKSQYRPGYLGTEQLFPERARLRDDSSERARLGWLRENFPETRQRFAARRFLQGHFGLAGLDPHAVRASTPSGSWSPAVPTAAS